MAKVPDIKVKVDVMLAMAHPDFILKLETVEGDPLTAEQWEQVKRNISATAVDYERQRIAAAVRGLPVRPDGYWVEAISETVSRAAVLRIVEAGDE